MTKEIISQKQGIAVMILFLLGSNSILEVGVQAGRDIWLAYIIVLIAIIPVYWMYSKVLTLVPGKNLFDILEIAFGRVLGRILMLPFIWYFIHLSSLIARDFIEFIKITVLINTPREVTAIMCAFIAILFVRAGMEVIGRYSAIMMPIIVLGILFFTLLYIPLFNFDNVKPVLYNGIKPVIKGSFALFVYPFGEAMMFTVVLNNMRRKESPFKVYLVSSIVAILLLFIISMRNLLSLGVENFTSAYFPTFTSASLIEIQDFIQRIEITVTAIYIVAGIIKQVVCIYAACVGFAKVFNMKNYREIVAPVGLISMILSLIVFNNTAEIFEWSKNVYGYYAFPFEVILPIIILIVAAIRLKNKKGKGIASNDGEIVTQTD